MHSKGPPEPLLAQCRQLIDDRAPADERANLLAVTQVLMRLRYNDPKLFAIFGGNRGMIESPLIQEIVDEATCKAVRTSVLRVLTARFDPIPSQIGAALQSVTDRGRLNDLVDWAVRCPDLESFRARLTP